MKEFNATMGLNASALCVMFTICVTTLLLYPLSSEDALRLILFFICLFLLVIVNVIAVIAGELNRLHDKLEEK